MEKRIGVSAKYIQKNAFWAKYNGQKLHLGKMQWRKRRGFGTYENIREKKAFEVTYNGEKSRGFGKK